jgi:ABC-2 type transport system permease protein
MTTPSNAVSEFPVDAEAAAPAAVAPTRPIYWSVRRELWENRSIYVVPLVVAALIVIGFLITANRLPERVLALSALDPADQRGVAMMPHCAVAGLIFITAFFVGAFYCLDALSGERRDRSILFWKSMPVSDRTTVLSKASIPLVILPALCFPVIVTTQLIILLASAVVLVANGVSVAELWTRLPLFQLQLVVLYSLPVIALWHAPVYGWLLLVSGWARRATLLWAVLPWLAIAVVEKVAFDTMHVASFLQYRAIGWLNVAFVQGQDGLPANPMTAVDPVGFLGAPGLWLGLAFAAGCIAAAVRLRRYREPS